MLALHPQVQNTLVFEIQKTIGDRAPTYDDFPNLVYPLCIMMETLRLFPPGIAIPKCNPHSDETLLGKYFVPKNTILAFDTVQLHRNPKYWGDDVHSFDPSRFDGREVTEMSQPMDIRDVGHGPTIEKIRIPVKGSFVPFSEGARSCLGTIFAISLSISRR